MINHSLHLSTAKCFSTSLTVTHLHGSASKNSSWIDSRQPVLYKSKEEKSRQPGAQEHLT